VVILATALVAARANAEGSGYLQDLAERDPADGIAQALAGFFQVRAGHDVAAATSKLDKAATMDVGLPQYFRGLALAELLPGGGHSEAGLAQADDERADQAPRQQRRRREGTISKMGTARAGGGHRLGPGRGSREAGLGWRSVSGALR
jgi:hypothetical protein